MKPKYVYSAHLDGDGEVELTQSDRPRDPLQLARNWAEVIFNCDSKRPAFLHEDSYRIIVEEIDGETNKHLRAWAITVVVRELITSDAVVVEEIPPGNV